MPYSPRVKVLAYKIDPACWRSYSGKPADFKRAADARRIAALESAQRIINPGKFEIIWAAPLTTPFSSSAPETSMPPMKIAMLLHFYGNCEAFSPEKSRRSEAYTQFVRELLRDGLIERPTDKQRKAFPGWAYKTTDKGRVLVKAIQSVAGTLPVHATPQWKMPS